MHVSETKNNIILFVVDAVAVFVNCRILQSRTTAHKNQIDCF